MAFKFVSLEEGFLKVSQISALWVITSCSTRHMLELKEVLIIVFLIVPHDLLSSTTQHEASI